MKPLREKEETLFKYDPYDIMTTELEYRKSKDWLEDSLEHYDEVLRRYDEELYDIYMQSDRDVSSFLDKVYADSDLEEQLNTWIGYLLDNDDFFLQDIWSFLTDAFEEDFNTYIKDNLYFNEYKDAIVQFDIADEFWDVINLRGRGFDDLTIIKLDDGTIETSNGIKFIPIENIVRPGQEVNVKNQDLVYRGDDSPYIDVIITEIDDSPYNTDDSIIGVGMHIIKVHDPEFTEVFGYEEGDTVDGTYNVFNEVIDDIF